MGGCLDFSSISISPSSVNKRRGVPCIYVVLFRCDRMLSNLTCFVFSQGLRFLQRAGVGGAEGVGGAVCAVCDKGAVCAVCDKGAKGAVCDKGAKGAEGFLERAFSIAS